MIRSVRQQQEEDDKHMDKRKYATRAAMTFGLNGDDLLSRYAGDTKEVDSAFEMPLLLLYQDIDHILAELANGFDLPQSTIVEHPYVTIANMVAHLKVKYGFQLTSSFVIINQSGKIALPSDIIYCDEGSSEDLATFTVLDATLGLDVGLLTSEDPKHAAVTSEGIKYYQEYYQDRPVSLNTLPDAPHCSVADLRAASVHKGVTERRMGHWRDFPLCRVCYQLA